MVSFAGNRPADGPLLGGGQSAGFRFGREQNMEIWTKILNVWTKRYKGDESASMDMDQAGATLKNRGESKFLDKRSTQVVGASS